jgi:phosphatidate cytidylyltransferase
MPSRSSSPPSPPRWLGNGCACPTRQAPPRAFSIATGTAVGAALLSAQDAYGWTIFWIAGGALAALLDRWPRGRAWESLVGVAYVGASVAILISLRRRRGRPLGDRLPARGGLGRRHLRLSGWKLGRRSKAASGRQPEQNLGGLIAGLSFGAGAGLLLADWVGLSAPEALALAIPTAIAAVLGDLLMSLAKRRFRCEGCGLFNPGSWRRSGPG